MNSLLDMLSLEEKKMNIKLLIILIIIAYAFNIVIRYVYIHYVGGIEGFYWQHHLMINNNDGYYWAEGARDILAGFHQKGDSSPVGMPASILTAMIAKFLPFLNFDVLIEYLPGYLGSLLVIPIILIGRTLGSTWLGFLASLVGGMAWSYYHRTMFGYYDTDMLIIVLSTFAVWSVIWSLTNRNIKYFFIAPLIEILMIKWHGGLFNIANGIFIMSAMYILYLKFIKKESIFKESLFLLFLIVPVLKIALLYKILVLIGLYFLTFKDIKKLDKSYFIFIVLGVYIVLIGIPWISSVLSNGYFTKATIKSDDSFKYFAVVNTVAEASKIPYGLVMDRISGSYIGFILGGFGYLLLLIKYPKMMVSLPMVVLGISAHKTGLRFTIFAVPFFALGMAYIAYLVGKISQKLFINEQVAVITKYSLSLLIMAGFIYPNYEQIRIYIMPTVFNKTEVGVLNKLKHIASRDDYVMTWWDYGYPIRYYADVKTFVDGAKHSGNVDFPVSFAITRDLVSSRNMGILDTYFYDKTYSKVSDPLKSMMKMYNFKDPNLFLEFLSTNIKLPKIKHNIYYYLPLRMFDILPTVAIFSTIDLKTGKRMNHFFYQSNRFKINKGFVIFNKNLYINLNRAYIQLGKNKVPIKTFSITIYEKNGKLNKTIQHIHKSGLNVIYMKNYHKFLILDDFYFNSAFIQLFVFENTAGLFKPVILNPLVKVFEVKK